jgi:hypothetical protein
MDPPEGVNFPDSLTWSALTICEPTDAKLVIRARMHRQETKAPRTNKPLQVGLLDGPERRQQARKFLPQMQEGDTRGRTRMSPARSIGLRPPRPCA